MDAVTLNHDQFCSFVGWSSSYTLNQAQKDRLTKLKDLGMQSISIIGRGKKANYSFLIPAGFWKMSLIPSMAYKEWGADYLNYLIEGKDIHNTDEGILVKFNSEIYEELAEKHNVEYKAVEATCGRIRTYLSAHGYIITKPANGVKTHRVKDQDREWITGPLAVQKDLEARNIWSQFFNTELARYKLIKPEATIVPKYLISAKASMMLKSDIARWLEVSYYRVSKRTHITDNMVADINYAQRTFLETLNMGIVIEEIACRQEHYRAIIAELKAQEERRKELEHSQEPSIEEQRAIRKQMDEAALETYNPRNMTAEEKEEWEKMYDFIFEEVFGIDGESE
jgi:hypothetical protein